MSNNSDDKNRIRRKNRYNGKGRSKIVDKINRLPIFDYDKMPIDGDYAEKPLNLPKISKPVRRILIILLVCSLAVYIWANFDKLNINDIGDFFTDNFLFGTQSSGYPCDIVGDEVSKGSFVKMGKNIAYLSDTSFVVMSQSGKKRCVRQHGLASPVIKASDSYAILYSAGGKSFQTESVSEELYSRITDYDIYCADIADNGFYTVVTGSKVYATELSVFSENNTQRFEYDFADCIIGAVDISDTGNTVCASGVRAVEGELQSSIYIFDIESDQPVVKKEFNDIAADVKTISADKALIVGTDAIYIVQGEKISEYLFNEKTLCAYDVTDDEILLVMSSENGHNCECAVLDNDLKVRGSFKTDLTVSAARLQNGNAVLLAGSRLCVYSLDAKLQKETSVGNDAQNFLALSSDCYILGIDKIKKY